jgi:hypothetical protein
VAVAAQNMHFEKEGAFTGEVSASMLKDIGVGSVILGHSERRQYFAETDEGVAKKTKVALDRGLTPISCVGELLAEREAGKTMEVVGRQVDAILNARASCRSPTSTAPSSAARPSRPTRSSSSSSTTSSSQPGVAWGAAVRASPRTSSTGAEPVAGPGAADYALP